MKDPEVMSRPLATSLPLVPPQLRQRAKGKLYGQNEDKDIVYHSGVSLVLAATKCG